MKKADNRSSLIAHHSSLALASFVAAFVFVFGWIVFGGGYVAGGDVFFYTYPLRAAAWRMIRAGAPALWLPEVLSGFPLLAMPQLALGYPLTWGHLFLPPHVAEQIFIFAPFLLAPAFTYLYARETGRGRTASTLAGLAFAYGGMMTNGFGMSGVVSNAVMWLPLVLVYVERARSRPFARAAFGASAAYALSVLGGHGQGFLYVGLIALAYAAFVSIFARSPSRTDARGETETKFHGEIETESRGESRTKSRGETRTESRGATARAAADSGGRRAAAWARGGLGRLAARSGWPRWRPLAVCVCALALGAGTAAFQILETMRAQRRSVRAAPAYEFFIEASFTLAAALKSFAAPLYHFIEVSTNVAPLAFLLALVAVASSLYALARRRATGVETRSRPARAPNAAHESSGAHEPHDASEPHDAHELHGASESSVAHEPDGAHEPSAATGRGVALSPDARVFFWAALAVLAFALMLGDATPLNRWLFRVPVLNLFRRPSRHVFEWTFALAVLAAYGFDALNVFAASRLRARREGARAGVYAIAAALLLLAGGAWLGFAWHGASFELPYVGAAVPAAEAVYVRWKLAFNLCLCGALAASLCVGARAARGALVAAVVLLACLVEPRILVRHWWAGTLKDSARLTTPSRTTRLLRALPPEENRVYVRANSATEEQARAPRFDALDLTALYGLHNVGGYEQLFPARYARALGEVDYDGVTPRAGTRRSLALLGARSRVLDLLNTTHVVTFADLRVTPDQRLDITPGEAQATLLDAPQGPTRDTSPSATRDTSPSAARDAAQGVSLDASRWQTVENFDGVVVLRNLRALPRAWLAAEAEPVDGEEALRRVTGESAAAFDPRRTALLEVAPAEMPRLPGGELAPGSSARVAEYGPGGIVVETESQTDALLVVGEVFYPGWEAEVDGRAARIHLTNFLLRGVHVPAGRHRVEMRYRSPAARNGAIISALSLACLSALALLARRAAKRESKLTGQR